MADINDSAEKSKVITPTSAAKKKIPMCKGNILFQLKEGARLYAGENKLTEAIEKATPPSKEVFKSMIISENWYPESAVGEMAKIVFELLGKDVVLKIVKERAVKAMGSSFKLFMRLFISPQRFAENNKKLWDAMHDSGNFKVTINEPKTHTIEITDFYFYTEEYVFSWIAYHEAVLELVGAKNIKSMHMKSKDKYLFKFSWD
jgi:hypothetical protein